MNVKRASLTLSLSFILIAAPAAAYEVTNPFGDWEELDDVLESTESTCESLPLANYLLPGCVAYDTVNYADSDEITAHQDIYEDTVIWKDTRDKVVKETEGRLNQTYGLAQAKAKFEALEALKNGSSESTAINIASSKVDDIYSANQHKVISWKNTEVLQFNKSLNTIDETPDLSRDEVYDLKNLDNLGLHNLYVYEQQYELYNGTQVTSYGVGISGSQYDYKLVRADLNATSGNYGVKSVSYDNSNTTLALDGNAYANLENKVNNQREDAQASLNGIVSDIYANYQAEDVDISQMTGPLETLIHASTAYDSTGFYSYRALTAEQAGYASNNSYAFKVEWDNPGEPVKNASGQLFVEEGAYNSTLEAGVQYDASNTYVEFIHATDNGSTSTRITGNFTILDMTNKETGEAVNVTSVQQTRFYTQSTKELSKQLEKIRERQNEILESSTITGGDISSAISDYLGNLVPENLASAKNLGIVALVAAVLLALA